MNQELHTWAKAQLAKAEENLKVWHDPKLEGSDEKLVAKLSAHKQAEISRDLQNWKQVIALLEGK